MANSNLAGIRTRDEFLDAIGQAGLVAKPAAVHYDAHRVVLEQVLTLDDKKIEILVGHLHTALGFEGSEVTGKTGDRGVDATGELNVANLAKVKVFVQAKRYKLDSKINANTVKQLRQATSFGCQDGFVTTADYQGAAADVALETGFPRIGLINGRQARGSPHRTLERHSARVPRALGVKTGAGPHMTASPIPSSKKPHSPEWRKSVDPKSGGGSSAVLATSRQRFERAADGHARIQPTAMLSNSRHLTFGRPTGILANSRSLN
ncbi:MAG: restriction endonuclease [Casimicrobiaceae bacterium]